VRKALEKTMKIVAETTLSFVKMFAKVVLN